MEYNNRVICGIFHVRTNFYENLEYVLGNLTSPLNLETTSVILFFQVITGHPLKGGGRGIHVLNFLKSFSPNIHLSIVEMWDTVIPKLTVYLEGIFIFCHSGNEYPGIFFIELFYFFYI